jgi:predicted metal-dependent hydrolase
MRSIVSNLKLGELQIELHRKRIKNLHLRVLPPDAKVRVSAPMYVSQRDVLAFVKSNQAWIEKTRTDMLNRPRIPVLEYVSGELHPYLGQLLRLELSSGSAKARAEFNSNTINVYAPIDSDLKKRRAILIEAYRKELKVIIHEMLPHWEAIVGVKSDDWNVRVMKNKWGSCNIVDKRIWLNLELIKYPLECIEYVLVHELVHLHERYHNARFYGFMDQFLPDWKRRKDLLNRFEYLPD